MKWIHVDDALPPRHTPVLVYNFETGVVRITTWSQNQWKTISGSFSILHAPYWAHIEYPTEYRHPKLADQTQTQSKKRPWKPKIKSTNTTTVKSSK